MLIIKILDKCLFIIKFIFALHFFLVRFLACCRSGHLWCVEEVIGVLLRHRRNFVLHIAQIFLTPTDKCWSKFLTVWIDFKFMFNRKSLFLCHHDYELSRLAIVFEFDQSINVTHWAVLEPALSNHFEILSVSNSNSILLAPINEIEFGSLILCRIIRLCCLFLGFILQS